MEFFDKLGKKASEAYKITADKTGKIAKETKLKLKINELKSQVSEIYEEIGKKVYEKHVREENISIKQDLESECTRIDVLSDEIEELLQQCLNLKDKKQCPKCYKEIDKEDKFCPNCGEKQTNEQPKEVEILEDLEKSEVKEENQNEKRIVEEELKDDIKEKEDKEKDNGSNTKKDVMKQDNNEISKTENRDNAGEDDNEETMENLEKTITIESNVNLEEDEEDRKKDKENTENNENNEYYEEEDEQ